MIGKTNDLDDWMIGVFDRSLRFEGLTGVFKSVGKGQLAKVARSF